MVKPRAAPAVELAQTAYHALEIEGLGRRATRSAHPRSAAVERHDVGGG